MQCVNSVVSFLTGHQGKQHHNVGGLGESIRGEAAESPTPFLPSIHFSYYLV